jgi:hypothetical protein
MSINLVTSGLVSPSASGMINGVRSATSQTASGTVPDCTINPVNSSIDATNFIYDGQTILSVNSTINQNANTVVAQYFDPVSGTPYTNGGSAFSGWNFDINNTSYLNSVLSTSALMSDNTSLYTNLQPISGSGVPPLNATGLHTLDITFGSATISPPTTPAPGLFFSLTANPYYVNSTGLGLSPPPNPTVNNVTPGYSNYNSDNFLFTSSYYIQQKNEILLIELTFTVSNTAAMNYSSNPSTIGVPTVSVIIVNKVIPQEVLASLASSSAAPAPRVKVYTAGPVPLQFNHNGSTWNPQTACSFVYNNVPLVIAPGFVKTYVTLPVIYVPGSATTYGNYLSLAGYQIVTDTTSVPVVNTTAGTGVVPLSASSLGQSYGHFVIGVAYSTNYQVYSNKTVINAEVLIKNVWRSPIAIYNSYSQFSVNDMATKQVVLLFGRNFNGGSFLVTNTGTPINSVNNYAVTSLRNFISIMRAVINLFDGSVSLVDYFLNPSVVASVNTMGSYNVTVLTLQPLLDGAIANPPTVATCPNMWYMILNSKNSASLAVDPSEQSVFGKTVGFNYLGLSNSILSATGNLNYDFVNLNVLSDVEGDLFGNSLSLGLNTIGTGTYYILIILPEAQFNPVLNSNVNPLTIYQTPSSLFYIMVTANSGTQFAPNSTGLVASGRSSSSGTTTSSSTIAIQPVYSINKLLLSTSNVPLF